MSSQTKKDAWKNELLTVKEVAAYLRVGRVTVWRWCKDGTIPAYRIGRNWRIHRDDLLHLMEIHCPSTPTFIGSSPFPNGRRSEN